MTRTSTSTVRVRYAETDKMGVVYYANYLVWFEVARTDCLRESGWTYRSMEEDGFALPVIEAHCDYKASARYDDQLAITVAARLMSPVRLAFDYTVSRLSDAVLIASGHTIHASVDRTGRPVRLPARVKGLFV